VPTWQRRKTRPNSKREAKACESDGVSSYVCGGFGPTAGTGGVITGGADRKLAPSFSFFGGFMKFKKGDQVRILRKAKTHERGWGNAWVDPMDAAVGKIGTVVSTAFGEQHDMEVEVRGLPEIWGFPDFVLQKVVRKKVKPVSKKRK